jgi:hypothetical protein
MPKCYVIFHASAHQLRPMLTAVHVFAERCAAPLVLKIGPSLETFLKVPQAQSTRLGAVLGVLNFD